MTEPKPNWKLSDFLAANPTMNEISSVAHITESDWAVWKFWLARIGVPRVIKLCTEEMPEGRTACPFSSVHERLRGLKPLPRVVPETVAV